MLNGLGKLFKNINESGKSPAQKVALEYPDNYSEQCVDAIKGLKVSKGDFDAVQESGAEELFLNSIQWINDGLEIDLKSLLNLIKAIKKYVPGDSWIEANEFRVHHDVDIVNREFILDPQNSDFLLELIGLGVDGHHFACNLLLAFKDELSLKFLADLIEVLMQSAEVVHCEHWQRTPVLGSPFIELIRTGRLSTGQLTRIYELVTAKKNAVPQYLISTIELYLSNNSQTPTELVKKFTKNEDLVWAWVSVDNPADHLEVIGNEAFIEVCVGEYARKGIDK